MRPPEFKHYFPPILTSDLVFNPILPIFKLGLDIVKTKFQTAEAKIAASRVFTYHQDKHSDKVSTCSQVIT